MLYPEVFVCLLNIILLFALVLLYVRVQNRCRQMVEEPTIRVAQMRTLVQEAQVLSTLLTTQLAEQARLIEMAEKKAPYDVDLIFNSDHAEWRSALDALPSMREDAPVTRALHRKTEQPRSLMPTTASYPGSPEAASPGALVPGFGDPNKSTRRVPGTVEIGSDTERARAMGMDPLGVAIQRKLKAQSALSA